MGSEFVEVGEIVAFDYFPDHFHVLVLIEHDLLFLCWSRCRFLLLLPLGARRHDMPKRWVFHHPKRSGSLSDGGPLP